MITYPELTEILKNKHFYPESITEVGVKGSKTTGLRIKTTPILQESGIERIKEALAEYPVTVQKVSNENYIVVKLKKS